MNMRLTPQRERLTLATKPETWVLSILYTNLSKVDET